MDTKRKGFANSSPRENMNFRKDCWHNTKLFFKKVWVIVINIYQKLNRKLESFLYYNFENKIIGMLCSMNRYMQR